VQSRAGQAGTSKSSGAATLAPPTASRQAPPVAAAAPANKPRNGTGDAGKTRIEGRSPQSAEGGKPDYEERKRLESEARRVKKAQDARKRRIEELETRIADREQAIRDIEGTMAAPGFFDNHESAKPVIDKHQALMWEVGDLMHQWEALQQTEV
jgi:ATP-binding cassette subfamily F protein 3